MARFGLRAVQASSIRAPRPPKLAADGGPEIFMYVLHNIRGNHQIFNATTFIALALFYDKIKRGSAGAPACCCYLNLFGASGLAQNGFNHTVQGGKLNPFCASGPAQNGFSPTVEVGRASVPQSGRSRFARLQNCLPELIGKHF